MFRQQTRASVISDVTQSDATFCYNLSTKKQLFSWRKRFLQGYLIAQSYVRELPFLERFSVTWDLDPDNIFILPSKPY